MYISDFVEKIGSRPISRVLFHQQAGRGNHSSRIHVTVHLKQPTQGQRGPRFIAMQ